MNWAQQVTQTLDALESRANPTTPADLQQIESLGKKLETLASQLSDLPSEEIAAAQNMLPTLMLRIQTVLDRLARSQSETAQSLTALRQRATAARAYQK